MFTIVYFFSNRPKQCCSKLFTLYVNSSSISG